VHRASGDRLLGGQTLYGDVDSLIGQIVAG
jgi:hypothetical protein